MSGDKVKFSPLQRLDIIDVDDLQALIYEYLEKSLGGVLGDMSGVLTDNSYTYNTTNSTIIPNDFTFLASTPDSLITDAVDLRFGQYNTDEAGAGAISYLTSKNAVQSYLDANGELPPSPTEASYSQVTHGSYYPIIYARTYRVDGETASRRFWSPSNNQEVTQNTIVRERQRLSFLTRADGLAPPIPTGDTSYWTAIGQIVRWLESEDEVSIPIMEWKYVHDNVLLDRLSYITTYSAYLSESVGLKGISEGLKAMINVNRADGTLDAQVPVNYQVSTDLSEKPAYSIDGLAGKINALEAKVVPISMVATLTFNSTDDGQGGLDYSVNINSSFVGDNGVVRNFLAGTASPATDALNASDVSDGFTITGVPVASIYNDHSYYFDVKGKTGTPVSAGDNADHKRLFMVELDQAFAGWKIASLSVTPKTNPSVSAFSVPTLYSSSSLEHSRVVSVNYKDTNNVQGSAYGFHFIMSHFQSTDQRADQLNLELFESPSLTRTYTYQIDFTLINPTAI